NKAKDYENVATWARRLLKVPAFQSKGDQERLSRLVIDAGMKAGEQKAESAPLEAGALPAHRGGVSQERTRTAGADECGDHFCARRTARGIGESIQRARRTLPDGERSRGCRVECRAPVRRSRAVGSGGEILSCPRRSLPHRRSRGRCP